MNSVYRTDQVEKHTRLMLNLQRNNARVSHILLRLAQIHLHRQKMEALFKELEALIRTITLEILLCEEILGGGADKAYDKIEVVIALTCDFCLENGKKTGECQDIQAPPKRLIPNQAWAIQLDGLTQLLASTASTLNVLLPSKYRREKQIRTLMRLGGVFSRQRRHLDKISVRRSPQISVIHNLNGVLCPDCGRPYEATEMEES